MAFAQYFKKVNNIYTKYIKYDNMDKTIKRKEEKL